MSIKAISFETYLARSFFSFYDVKISPRKVKIPRKASKSRSTGVHPWPRFRS